MSNLRYELAALLCRVLSSVPVGTNRGLFALLWALLSGRLLASRGAVFPALAAMRLADAEVQRSEAALANGRFNTKDLVSDWHKVVGEQGKWRPHSYEGVQPVACDLSAGNRHRPYRR